MTVLSRENKNITIMVVPHSQKPLVSFKFSLVFLQCVGFILIFVPILLVSFFNSYNSAKAVFPELEQLRLDNQIKSELIGQLANETEKMLENLKRVQNLEQELLELNDMEGPGPEPVTPTTQKDPPSFRVTWLPGVYFYRSHSIRHRGFARIATRTRGPHVHLKENIEEQYDGLAYLPAGPPGKDYGPIRWRTSDNPGQGLSPP